MDFNTILTDSTCGEACWEAREDVCRCSCRGANHGIYESGERPDRTSKIGGVMYKLIDIGGYIPILEKAREVNQTTVKNTAKVNEDLTYTYYYRETDKRAPMRVKKASRSQIERWSELESHKLNPVEAWDWQNEPYLLWERMS